MSRVVRKAELARWAKVSRMAVTKFAKSVPEIVEGGKINVDHALVREWLADKGVHVLPIDVAPPPPPQLRAKPKVKAKAKPKGKTKPKKVAQKKVAPKTPAAKKAEPAPAVLTPAPQPAETTPAVQTRIGNYDISDLENLTVREVVMRHGSVDGFKRFVEALNKIAEYKYRELRVETQRGEVVRRDRVAGVVFSVIDVAFSRLVSDVPESLSKIIVARVESGGDDTVADVERLIRDANSKALKNVKTAVRKTGFLKDANH